MAKADAYDLVVLGAGQGGYAAALRAAQSSMRVALVEARALGGTCVHRGCIPSKALLAAADVLDAARRADEYGLEIGRGEEKERPAARASMEGLRRRNDQIVSRIERGIAGQLERHGVEVVKGRGRFLDERRIAVRGDKEERIIEAERVLIATGGKPVAPPALGYDGRVVVTTDELLQCERIPERLAVVGGGVIGCEFASLFSDLGSRVTVIELMDRLLHPFEEESARAVAASLRRRGVEARTGAVVQKVEVAGRSARIRLADGEIVEADLVLIAVGRAANTVGLGLEQAGVDVNDRREIVVDKHMATSRPGIYAVGDCTSSRFKLAHVAARQAAVAVAHMLGGADEMDERAVPNVVFTRPELASVGWTRSEAEAAGHRVAEGKFFLAGNGKALAMGRPEGFVKVIADAADGRVLGVHAVGADASSIIAEATLAVQWGLTATQVAATIHAHPTLPEAFLEAAAAAAAQLEAS